MIDVRAPGLFGRLRTKFAFVIAVAMMPAGVVAILQAISNAETKSRERGEVMAKDVQVRASDERDLLVQVRETLRSVGRSASRALNTTGTCETVLQDMPEIHRWMSRIVILDAQGDAVCGTREPFSVKGMPEWANDFLNSPRFTLAEARNSRLTGERVLIAFLPIPPVGSETYAIASGIKVSAFRELSSTDEDDHLPFALVGNRGTTIINREADNDEWLPPRIEELLAPGINAINATGGDDQFRSYVTYPLVPQEVWAISGEPHDRFSQLILSREGLPILMPLVLWLIAVGVAFIAIDRLVTRHVKHLQRVARRIGDGEFDTPVVTFDGAPQEIESLGATIAQMAEDLADRETRMRDLLSAQKSLLLEVHHRVKNNLQMISSLMNIQLRRVSNEAERGMLQLVQDRIHGLALVHQNLYSTERLDHVALDQLVRDVCNHLSTSLRPVNSEINMELDLEPVTVDAAVATPIALFLTEAMGNVFKHASAPGARTHVDVKLAQDGSIFRLTIQNRQARSPKTETQAGPSGLGNRLMEGFAKQLAGTLDWTQTDGLFSVTLTAPMADQASDFQIRQGTDPSGTA